MTVAWWLCALTAITPGQADDQTTVALAADVSAYGSFTLQNDTTIGVTMTAAERETPLDHFQRDATGAWPVDLVADEQGGVALRLTTPAEPITLRIEMLVDRRPFSYWVDDVIERAGEQRPTLPSLDDIVTLFNSVSTSDSVADNEDSVAVQTHRRGTADQKLAAFLQRQAARAEEAAPVEMDREEIDWLLTEWRPGPPVFLTKNRFASRGDGRVKLWPVLDGDRDGQLSAEELELISDRLSAVDKNRDKIISASELPEVVVIGLRTRAGRLEANSSEPPAMTLRFEVEEDAGRLSANVNSAASDSRLSIPRPGWTLEVVPIVDRRTIGQPVAKSQFSVAARIQPHPIWNLCDSDHDGQLNEVEQRAVPDRLLSLDRNQDGVITTDEIPRVLQLVIAQGPWAASVCEQLNVIRTVPNQPQATPPAWFAGMDRNDDRLLSPDEFLGDRASFDKMDADDDGFVNVSEALAAE